MKKKLVMVAVLLGALSLGACVDNNESTSVEAVRNAKAEQLKGLAALANAHTSSLSSFTFEGTDTLNSTL